MPKRSSTLDLARATLKVANKSTRRLRANTPPDAPTQHLFALVESLTVFQYRCTRAIRSDSVAKLTVFFEITIGDLIDSGQMGWENEQRRRPFALSCVEFLAQRAGGIAAARGTSITPHILDEAAREMIIAKKPECPLPGPRALGGPFVIFGSPCIKLAKLIGQELMRRD